MVRSCETVVRQLLVVVFFFNDTATTEIYTLSLHDALPIYKGPVFVALETARAFGDAPPLSVKFLIEGGEEIGSPALPGFLRAHAGELRADLVVSADGAMWRPSEPSVPIAAKGLLALDIEVTGPSSDPHSGRHGGAVQNPNHALASVLAGLHDTAGRVAAPGLYPGGPDLGER